MTFFSTANVATVEYVPVCHCRVFSCLYMCFNNKILSHHWNFHWSFHHKTLSDLGCPGGTASLTCIQGERTERCDAAVGVPSGVNFARCSAVVEFKKNFEDEAPYRTAGDFAPSLRLTVLSPELQLSSVPGLCLVFGEMIYQQQFPLCVGCFGRRRFCWRFS